MSNPDRAPENPNLDRPTCLTVGGDSAGIVLTIVDLESNAKSVVKLDVVSAVTVASAILRRANLEPHS